MLDETTGTMLVIVGVILILIGVGLYNSAQAASAAHQAWEEQQEPESWYSPKGESIEEMMTPPDDLNEEENPYPDGDGRLIGAVIAVVLGGVSIKAGT